MKPKSLFRDPLVKFTKSGEPVSKPQIKLAVPEEFMGKDGFIRFYLQHNGGSFREFAYFYRDTFWKVGRTDWNLMYVFNLLRIPRNGSSDVDYQLSISALREAFLKGVTNAKLRDFLNSHIPIAGNGSGDYYWIEIPSGRIQFLDHESVGEVLLQPIEVASTFMDFVANFRAQPREEDKII
jgi:hypothetical protein